MKTLKHVLFFGLLAGIILNGSWWIASLLWGKEADMQTSEVLGYISMLLALSMVFVGVKRYRDRMTNGSFGFGKAFTIGLYIVLIASCIYVIGWMVYYPRFMPDFADTYYQAEIDRIQAAGLSQEETEAQISKTKEWIETYKKPQVMAAFTFVEIFPIGLIISLISAFILKRKIPAKTD